MLQEITGESSAEASPAADELLSTFVAYSLHPYSNVSSSDEQKDILGIFRLFFLIPESPKEPI